MIQILHNPRCSKSRECLLLLQEKIDTFEVVNYLDGALKEEDIRQILKKLNCKPIEIIRTKDELYINNYINKNLTDEEWIFELTKNPKLIERPIVINGEKAAIGRPMQKVLDIL